MALELDEDQWDLGGVVIGRGQPLMVEDFSLDDIGARLGDVDVPGGDGVVFGYDFHEGRVITLEVFTDTADAAEARSAWRALESVWRDRALRYAPREVVPLRMRLGSGGTVVVYGRPRKFTPSSLRSLEDGVASAVTTFDTAHGQMFSDVEQVVTLTLVASGGGGITWPVTWPITWAPGGERQDAAHNSGDADTWPVIRIDGPISQPVVELVGTGLSLRLATSLSSGQSVTIDPRPWVRSIVRSDGASLAGTARGVRLEELRLPPGQTVIHFGGTDLTGTSRCEVRWRDAHSTP